MALYHVAEDDWKDVASREPDEACVAAAATARGSTMRSSKVNVSVPVRALRWGKLYETVRVDKDESAIGGASRWRNVISRFSFWGLESLRESF